jgi:hypothetical protein
MVLIINAHPEALANRIHLTPPTLVTHISFVCNIAVNDLPMIHLGDLFVVTLNCPPPKVQYCVSETITVFLISYSSHNEVAVVLINSTPTRRSVRMVWCLQSHVVGPLHRLAGGKNVPYHNDFARLKKDVQNRTKAADRIKVASLLGRRAWEPQAGDEEPSLADHLRLELAGGLLIQAAEAKSDGVDNSVLQAFYFGGEWIFSSIRGSPMEAARWVCGGRKFAPLGVTTSSASTAA